VIYGNGSIDMPFLCRHGSRGTETHDVELTGVEVMRRSGLFDDISYIVAV